MAHLGDGSAFDRRLWRLLDEARVDEAAQTRALERWLRQQASEEVTLTGVLLDLAERNRPVVVDTASGRSHRAAITAIGPDFCALRTATSADVLIPFAALAAIRPRADESITMGERVVSLGMRFADALVELAADRPRVLIVTAGTAPDHAGLLVGAGTDVVTLRIDGTPRAAVYVPTGSIAEVASA